jgi:uncharacterized protein (DUF2235 family)
MDVQDREEQPMKRLIICADGTWNVRDQVDKTTGRRRPTNVTKVARAIVSRADVDQVVIYHDGVGTGRGLDKFTGGAFGDGIEINIRELYRSILYNYCAGDELFFFGFSRGAFTARSLVGFLNAVGLLTKGDDYWVPELYDCYEQGKRPGSPEWNAMLRKIENPILPCPDIKFVGVWDTVGALGAPGFLGQIFNKNKYAYHDVGLNTHVQNAFHALATDEHRKPFAPSVWDRPVGWNGHLEQAWFSGVHCNVGGSETPDGLANQALHWMVEKAEGLGLVFDKPFLAHYRPCFNAVMADSMTAAYRLLGTLDRPIGEHGPEEKPHQAAIDRRNMASLNYAPKNLDAYLAKNPNVQPYATTRVDTRSPC